MRLYVCPNQRVDSVIESIAGNHRKQKINTIINLSLTFYETTIYDNIAFLENLVAVH